MPRRLVPDGFVGYVRVSTESLMDEGHGLQSQTLALKEYAVGQCLDIVIVPASEPGHGPIIGRPRFLEAIQQANSLKCRALLFCQGHSSCLLVHDDIMPNIIGKAVRPSGSEDYVKFRSIQA